MARHSSQIEATTATTETKTETQKMKYQNNDWTWEDETNHLIEETEISYEDLEEEA
jgi:hypothetical protein